MLEFGNHFCRDWEFASSREWLISNGAGSYAMGTVSGANTRRYHGYLIGAKNPPLGRTLLVAHLQETITYLHQEFKLTCEIRTGENGDVRADIAGLVNIRRFYLDGTSPVWEFQLGDAILEKRVWMLPANVENPQPPPTTYVQYTVLRASAPMLISIDSYVNYRDHHHSTQRGLLNLQVDAIEHTVRVHLIEDLHGFMQDSPNERLDLLDAPPFYLTSNQGQWRTNEEWGQPFYLPVEMARGYPHLDHNLLAATLQASLTSGKSLALNFSLQPADVPTAGQAWQIRQQYEQELLDSAQPLLTKTKDVLEWQAIRQLVLSADQFVVTREHASGFGHTILAGYPWFNDWGRDTMISLPGLVLATGRAPLARSILRTFATWVDQGMLPNCFPDVGQTPEYNTVDATLWYFEAIRAYFGETADVDTLRVLFPTLRDIISWHQRGTRYQIQLDPQDGLLYAGEEGLQLTWMDVKTGDWVVTPRTGKPVEINALWYNALNCMAQFAEILAKPAHQYRELAKRAEQGFARFWNSASKFCYDVIDTPNGDDPSLRPNQLLAVSLTYSPLPIEQQRQVVRACTQWLLTPVGLRSLSPAHPDYTPTYAGELLKRDASYHQGTVWSWLIGPYLSALQKIGTPSAELRHQLRPLFLHLSEHGLGSVSEVFDGQAPHLPEGCPAQAWGVAEILRLWAGV
ncbi:MAG TPA: amylo-alpha-1,6-glucosidase [Anaerolineales bacterium]|nr:amylo-alpha-1,6-glucosidase [Anaerolineales bacterium]